MAHESSFPARAVAGSAPTRFSKRSSGGGSAPVERYRLTAPLPAVWDKAGGERLSVMLPAGAILKNSSQRSTTLLGMIGVYWKGRHYSVYPKDLLQKAERVSTA